VDTRGANARASTEMFYDAEQDVGFQPVASGSFLKFLGVTIRSFQSSVMTDTQ